MSILGTTATRTTTALSTANLLSALRHTQRQLLDAQNQIATGLAVGKPSQAPEKASIILSLTQRITDRDQYQRNLGHAARVLDGTDVAMGDALRQVEQAKSIALEQVNLGDPEIRRNQAGVIDGVLTGLLQVANRVFDGVALFGGDRGGMEPPFQEFLGGIRYVGAKTDMAADVGLLDPLAFTSNGEAAFGALSMRVMGDRDFDPQATAATRINDVNGARGVGIRRGYVVVTVNGVSANVDLTTADTLGDVVTRVNAAIAAVDPAAGSLGIAGSGFELTAGAGDSVSISELGNGYTAGDLGIVLSASGETAAGADIDPRLTSLTSLASLGVPIDFTSGLRITQGARTAIADFSGAQTVEDVINEIERLNLGLRLEINAQGTGLNLLTDVSGIELSVGEVNGGTTATDLGIRTFNRSTLLTDISHGLHKAVGGIHRNEGQNDLRFRLADGTRDFEVNLDGAATIGDVIDAIAGAAAAAGLNVGSPGDAGTDFNVGLAVDGNGFQIEDRTAGGGAFAVEAVLGGLAAGELGLLASAPVGGTLVSSDVTKVRVESVFTHLMNLRDSLVSNDESGIFFAGDKIETDLDALARAAADIGVRSNQVKQQANLNTDVQLSEKALLSQIQDADLTEVITRFTTLQQQLQASFQVGSLNLQQSFLDFLR